MLIVIPTTLFCELSAWARLERNPQLIVFCNEMFKKTE